MSKRILLIIFGFASLSIGLKIFDLYKSGNWSLLSDIIWIVNCTFAWLGWYRSLCFNKDALNIIDKLLDNGKDK